MRSGSSRNRAWLFLVLLLACECAPKKVAAPPPAPPPPPPPAPIANVVVLLPDPTGKSSAISVTNQAGTQMIGEPYQAVRVARQDSAPTPPAAMDQAEVQRVFGGVLDILPAPEVVFTLYFGVESEVLLPESQNRLAEVLDAIRTRHSTAISVIGHTDTTADPQFNYKLGLRRAQGVADLLIARGVERANVFVESHGEADQAVKTDRGVAERRNRRVEVTVR